MSNDTPGEPPAIDVTGLEVGGVRVGKAKLQGLGRLGELLLPERSAKGKFASAIAARIERGDALSEFEEEASRAILGIETKRYANFVNVAERGAKLLPEVQESLKRLPEYTGGPSTSSEWANKFRRISEDVENSVLVDLYARVLAGEVTRPGSYSIRTLTVLESLSADELKLFQRAQSVVIAGDCIDPNQEVLSHSEVLLLMECGLLVSDTKSNASISSLCEDRYLSTIRYGDRALVLSRDEKAPKVSFNALFLSIPGSELSMIPQMAPNEEYLREFARGRAVHNKVVVQWCLCSDLDDDGRPKPDAQIHEFDPPLIKKSE
tara:strand:+ start:26352 stop:27314 length:963 start_codon:yes stop_codon:yes gene_type:complete